MKRSTRGSEPAKWLPLTGGLLFGFGVLWMTGKGLMSDELFFGQALFEEIGAMNGDRTGYLIYLLKIRGLQTLFLMGMSFLRRKKAGLWIWAWLTGNGFGIGCYAMIKRWEWQGVIGYPLILLPHYLCYFYAYQVYYDIDCNSQNGGGEKAKTGNGRMRRAVVLGVVIIGILLECYVNPYFLKLFSKIFFS